MAIRSTYLLLALRLSIGSTAAPPASPVRSPPRRPCCAHAHGPQDDWGRARCIRKKAPGNASTRSWSRSSRSLPLLQRSIPWRGLSSWALERRSRWRGRSSRWREPRSRRRIRRMRGRTRWCRCPPPRPGSPTATLSASGGINVSFAWGASCKTLSVLILHPRPPTLFHPPVLKSAPPSSVGSAPLPPPFPSSTL